MHVLIFFSVRVILIWNRLPAALVQENNLSVFMSMLRIFDFSYTLLYMSSLLTLCWPFGQYVLCLYFYAIACTSVSLLVDELNK